LGSKEALRRRGREIESSGKWESEKKRGMRKERKLKPETPGIG